MKTKQTRTLILLSTVAFVAFNSKAYGSSAGLVPDVESVATQATTQAAPAWIEKILDHNSSVYGPDFAAQFSTLDDYLKAGTNDLLSKRRGRDVNTFLTAVTGALRAKSASLETEMDQIKALLSSSATSSAVDTSELGKKQAAQATLTQRALSLEAFLAQSLGDLKAYKAARKAQKSESTRLTHEAEESREKKVAEIQAQLALALASEETSRLAIIDKAEKNVLEQEAVRTEVERAAAKAIETQEALRREHQKLLSFFAESVRGTIEVASTQAFDAEIARLSAQRDADVADVNGTIAEINAQKEKDLEANGASKLQLTEMATQNERLALELEATTKKEIKINRDATLMSLENKFEEKHGPYNEQAHKDKLTASYTLGTWRVTEAMRDSVSLKFFNELLAEIVPPTVSIMAESGGASATAGELTDEEEVVVGDKLDPGYDPDDESTAPIASDAFSARTDLKVQLSETGERTVTVSERENVVISGDNITIGGGSINVDGVTGVLPQTSGSISIVSSGDLTVGGDAELSARMFPVGSSKGLVAGTSDAPAPTTVVLGSSATNTEDGLVRAVPVTRAHDFSSYAFVAQQAMHPTLTVEVGRRAPRPMMMEPLVCLAQVSGAKLDMSAAIKAKEEVPGVKINRRRYK